MNTDSHRRKSAEAKRSRQVDDDVEASRSSSAKVS